MEMGANPRLLEKESSTFQVKLISEKLAYLSPNE
jgi:chorismate-pyruvate lyase